MSNPTGMKIAVIGGGISGIAAAKVLKQNGFTPIIFEKAERLGGIWAVAYADVRLQNTEKQYRLCDFPWPFKPDFYPTSEQVLRYFHEVVEHLRLDLRLGDEVTTLEEMQNGWLVKHKNEHGIHEDLFEYVIVATGQYTEGKRRPQFPGEEQFCGEILTEREIHHAEQFNSKSVLVIGFGKSALDMVTFAAPHASQVHHLFRIARWTVPERFLGIHNTYIFLCRFASMMMPSWVHPFAPERFLHKHLGWAVHQFWRFVSFVIHFQEMWNAFGKGTAARERLKIVWPDHILVSDLRSAAALAPKTYYPLIAEGKIIPYRAELSRFSTHGVILKDEREICCDLVVLSLGSESPTFPFMPEKYRNMLEEDKDGPQFYRHLIHPRIARMGFAGFNHGFMHIPAVEIGTLWLCASLHGELKLPTCEVMEKNIERIRAWKRSYINFETSRACAVNTRYQQYLDLLLKDLGLSPYRKLPNLLAEFFARYDAKDYKNVFEEYAHKKLKQTTPLVPLDM